MLAQYLKRLVEERPELELAAPVQLNIVCFRFRSENSDEVNTRIVTDIQESGIAVPSTTTIDGRLAIRAAIVNHRTQACDLEALVAATVRFGVTAKVDRRCLRIDAEGRPTVPTVQEGELVASEE